MPRVATLTLALILLPALLAPALASGSPGDARKLLEEAAAALRAVRSVEYDFVFGAPDDPSGWVTGRTRMRQVTDASDSWLHVRGVLHGQPAFDVSERRFDYAVDRERAYQIDHTARTFQSAPIGIGGNSLSTLAVYGFITEFVERDPLWKERDHATGARLLPAEKVDGVVCDVVEVEFGEGARTSLTTWWLGRADRLPRRGEWRTRGSSAPPLVMEFRSLATDRSWSAADFVLEPPDGYEIRPVELAGGLGEPLPDLALPTPDGEPLRLADLEGTILVLDFWNTWCYICRTQTPAIAELAAELGGDTVRFFGVNIFETGDPVAYWREKGYPFAMLLEGEELAQSLDLPYQPGIAVVDAAGEVVFTQLGGSPDRAEKVRRAIAAARVRSR